MPKRGSKRTEESIRKQREWWKVPEHREQAKKKALETWAEKKIQGLPDQRENYAGYQAGYQKLWRQTHPRLLHLEASN